MVWISTCSLSRWSRPIIPDSCTYRAKHQILSGGGMLISTLPKQMSRNWYREIVIALSVCACHGVGLWFQSGASVVIPIARVLCIIAFRIEHTECVQPATRKIEYNEGRRNFPYWHKMKKKWLCLRWMYHDLFRISGSFSYCCFSSYTLTAQKFFVLVALFNCQQFFNF